MQYFRVDHFLLNESTAVFKLRSCDFPLFLVFLYIYSANVEDVCSHFEVLVVFSTESSHCFQLLGVRVLMLTHTALITT